MTVGASALVLLRDQELRRPIPPAAAATDVADGDEDGDDDDDDAKGKVFLNTN